MEIVTLGDVFMPTRLRMLLWYNGGIESSSTRALGSKQMPRPPKQELKPCHEGAESCGHSAWKHHQKELFRAKRIPCVGPAHVFLVNQAALPGFRRVSV